MTHSKDRLKEAFGKLPREELTASDFERIRKYHDKIAQNAGPDCFVIDEATWNDLNMNDVFAYFNATQSSIGEEVLYHRLHCMALKPDETFQKLTEQFSGHEDVRILTQESLQKLGKIRNVSITEILDQAEVAKEENNTKHIVIDIALLLSIALIFVHPGIGFLLTFFLLSYSVITYFQRKSEITPFYTAFFYMNRMFRSLLRIESIDQNLIDADHEEITKIRSVAKAFRRNAFFLTGGVKFSENIFDILLDYVRILFHIDIIKFNTMLRLFREHHALIDRVRMMLGTLDAAIACANAKAAMPQLSSPTFCDEKTLSVTDAFHPLLSAPVANSVTTTGGILITGSNASGKSTFIKSIALCALLAQTIGLVNAKEYRACRFRMLTSMALTDRIREGESYYIVEIRSLKRIIDLAAKQDVPVLCFIDEVLRGTNTVERIAASSRILSALNHQNAICFAATHDIELARILQNEFTNVHFEEEVSQNDVRFSYRLKEGASDTRNAIRLLAVAGFDPEVVKASEEAAEAFLATNQWSTIT